MKLEIENTTRTVLMRSSNGAGLPMRVWEGKTSGGIPVFCFIGEICAPDGVDVEQFKKELFETIEPSPEVAALPSRLIL